VVSIVTRLLSVWLRRATRVPAGNIRERTRFQETPEP